MYSGTHLSLVYVQLGSMPMFKRASYSYQDFVKLIEKSGYP